MSHCDRVSSPKPVGEGVLLEKGCWSLMKLRSKTNYLWLMLYRFYRFAGIPKPTELSQATPRNWVMMAFQKTTYVLQFLWGICLQCLTFFTSSSGLDSRSCFSWIQSTWRWSKLESFSTKKAVLYSTSDSDSEACFLNPFSAEKCWVIICPSHQVITVFVAHMCAYLVFIHRWRTWYQPCTHQENPKCFVTPVSCLGGWVDNKGLGTRDRTSQEGCNAWSPSFNGKAWTVSPAKIMQVLYIQWSILEFTVHIILPLLVYVARQSNCWNRSCPTSESDRMMRVIAWQSSIWRRWT